MLNTHTQLSYGIVNDGNWFININKKLIRLEQDLLSMAMNGILENMF